MAAEMLMKALKTINVLIQIIKSIQLINVSVAYLSVHLFVHMYVTPLCL